MKGAQPANELHASKYRITHITVVSLQFPALSVIFTFLLMLYRKLVISEFFHSYSSSSREPHVF